MISPDNTDDIIDVADLKERVEYLEDGELLDLSQVWERDRLRALLDECYANAVYDGLLIHETHFIEYAKEYAINMGAISRDMGWPANHIDWFTAAEELRQDYTAVDFDGFTYYTRGG